MTRTELARIAFKHLLDFAEEDKDLRADILARAGLDDSEENWDRLNSILAEFAQIARDHFKRGGK